jgi:seryl-tRNA synthetase
MLARTDFREDLFSAGLLIPTGVDGLYGRSGDFERVIDAINDYATRLGAEDGAEIMRFPPALNRAHFERSDYLKSFPQLAGTVHCFCGDERGHREILRCVDGGTDWTAQQRPSEIVLTPAACYPVYPAVARRGDLGSGGALVDALSYCFRHEPSLEPTRQQLFRMREYIRFGNEAQVLAFREAWLARGSQMIAALALPHEVDVANDPFFGRAGRVLADSQREQRLKFEMLIPILDAKPPTACMSFNYHVDHFGTIWGLRTADGSVAHTACVGFGLERLALALFRHHGFDLAAWPDPVSAVLWP